MSSLLTPSPSLTPIFNNSFLSTFTPLTPILQRTEQIWQEGLLIDFLQKKFIDNWARNFLVFSSYLVNERLFFDWVIRFYSDLVLWPGHQSMIFEFLNVGSTLIALVTLLLFTLVTLVFFYLLIL